WPASTAATWAPTAPPGCGWTWSASSTRSWWSRSTACPSRARRCSGCWTGCPAWSAGSTCSGRRTTGRRPEALPPGRPPGTGVRRPSAALRVTAVQAGPAPVQDDQRLGAALVAHGGRGREAGPFAGDRHVLAGPVRALVGEQRAYAPGAGVTVFF